MRKTIKIKSFVLCAVFVFLLCGKTPAQQTIFNVPSADVLDKGKVYVELDANFKPNNREVLRRFSSFVPRVVAGVGGSVEIGLNLTGNVNPGADATTLLLAVKWRVCNSERKGVAVVVGDSVYIPVRHKTYNVGNYAYAQISKTFKSKTRLTGGGYYFTKNVVSTAARGGGQFGFEQPITEKFGVAADWFTGKNSVGYFTPGVNFKPHPKVTGYVGYSIGNGEARKGNHFFYAAIGVNLN